MPTISELSVRAYKTAEAHGFHEYKPTFGVPGQDTRHILSWLLLIVTEVAEAGEAVRKGNLTNFEEELADVFIRLVDTCYALEINLEAAVLAKMDVNDQRSYKHGGKLA